MNVKEQLQARLQLKEGAEVEYKSAKGGFPQSFWSSFSAFANTDGGILVLGVKEKNGDFVPDGLTEEQVANYRKKFWDDAHNKACVSIPLLVESDVEEIKTDGGSFLLVFHVPRAPYNLRPVYLTLNPFGNTYRRRHEGDYVCMDDDVRQMISDANSLRSSVDSRILRGYTIEDIDMPSLHHYRRLYNFHHENHPWNEDDDMVFMEHIGAYRKDRATSTEGFTVAGMLMFGKTNSITDPECCPYFFPDYRERLSTVPQIRWSNRVYPDGTWEANIFQFYTRVLPMLQHALPVPFRLDENQMRIDTTTAHTALREAFANSIIHCAYTVMGNITVDRFFDKIVLSNPGTMLVSKEEYEEGGHSVCRNPLIQKMFVFIGVGEKGGSGADVITKGWLDNGWKHLPKLREVTHPDRVELTLFIPTVTDDKILDNVEKPTIIEKPTIKSLGNEKTDDKILDNVEKPTIIEKPTIKSLGNEKTDDKLLDNVEKPTITASGNEKTDDKISKRTLSVVFDYILGHPNCKTADIATAINLQLTQTKWYLYRLLDEDKIIAHGANRNRTYSVK